MKKKFTTDFGDKIIIYPEIWPNKILEIQPGNLLKFTPSGNGVYGYQNRFGENPIQSAPKQEPSAGVIYFNNKITKEDLNALLRILGVRPGKDYAVFLEESKQPDRDCYLIQVRIVTKFALRFMFGAISTAEYEKFPEQKFSVNEILWKFIEKEKERWGTSCFDDGGLYGLFGGDGDYAREELSFAFMIENDYHGVFRIWSRAWLVTK